MKISYRVLWLFVPVMLVQMMYAQVIDFNNVGKERNRDSILFLFQDYRGFIWISTNKGLGIFDGTRFMPTQFYNDEGELLSAIATGMRQLNDKNKIAVNTNRGQIVLDLKHDAFSWVHQDSLYDITPGTKNLVDRDGTRWTLTDKGVDIVPAATVGKADLHRLHIIGVYVNNQLLVNGVVQGSMKHVTHTNVDYMRKMVLNHDQNDIFIHFIYTSYTMPAPSFWYRLKGRDEKWRRLVSLRDGIKFIHLPYGNYTLEVTDSPSADYLGNCYTLDICILPPWWRTGWAYTFYVLLLTGMLLGGIYVVRFMKRKRKEFDNLLLTISKEDAERQTAQKKEINDKQSETTSEKDREFLSKVISMVRQHCSDSDYDVSKLASELCMSRATLFRRFQMLVGQTPAEFIRTLRLEKAAKLLSETSKPVTDIAYGVGFTDVGYFGKCFKRKYGVLPSQYRQNSHSQ